MTVDDLVLHESEATIMPDERLPTGWRKEETHGQSISDASLSAAADPIAHLLGS